MLNSKLKNKSKSVDIHLKQDALVCKNNNALIV